MLTAGAPSAPTHPAPLTQGLLTLKGITCAAQVPAPPGPRPALCQANVGCWAAGAAGSGPPKAERRSESLRGRSRQEGTFCDDGTLRPAGAAHAAVPPTGRLEARPAGQEERARRLEAPPQNREMRRPPPPGCALPGSKQGEGDSGRPRRRGRRAHGAPPSGCRCSRSARERRPLRGSPAPKAALG